MLRQAKNFRQIDHTADVGLKIWGSEKATLFENAAVGLFDIITNLVLVKPQIEEQISLTSTDEECLLVDWLSELNFLFLTKRILYSEFKILQLSDNQLSATISGEPLDLKKHEIHIEVKAVTFHKLYIKKSETGYSAQVIFDL